MPKIQSQKYRTLSRSLRWQRRTRSTFSFGSRASLTSLILWHSIMNKLVNLRRFGIWHEIGVLTWDETFVFGADVARKWTEHNHFQHQNCAIKTEVVNQVLIQVDFHSKIRYYVRMKLAPGDFQYRCGLKCSTTGIDFRMRWVFSWQMSTTPRPISSCISSTTSPQGSTTRLSSGWETFHYDWFC